MAELAKRTALRRVDRANRKLMEARRMLVLAAVGGRRIGATWEQIGKALGVTAQAACSRFRHAVDQVPDDEIPRFTRW